VEQLKFYISILTSTNWDAISEKKFNIKSTFTDTRSYSKTSLCLGKFDKSLHNNIYSLSSRIKSVLVFILLTWSIRSLIFLSSFTYTAKQRNYMAKNDKWRGQNWFLMISHNKMITLVLPYNIGDCLHL
jgi:hypothetical protein